LQTAAVGQYDHSLFGEGKGVTAVTGRSVVGTHVQERANHLGEGVKSCWRQTYVRRLAVTDAAVIVTSVAIAQFARFGTDPATLTSEVLMHSYTAVSSALIFAWFSALVIYRSREPRVVGNGVEEFRRVARASIALFGSVAIVSFLLKLEVARGYLAVALPLGLISLLLTRWLWRRWLRKERSKGRFISAVLVVGSHKAAAAMAQEFERMQSAGYRVAGVCVPGWGTGRGDSVNVDGHAVPVLGDESAVIDALWATDANMVAVSNTEYLGADGIRALAWQLEAIDAELVVAPGVVDVAGPRLQIHPVAGLPLLHLDKPQYRGAVKAHKAALDLIAAGLGLLMLWPFFILVAVLIKLDSPGPVFYRAQRIGLNGKPFAMLKFRSMVVDANQRRTTLVGRNEGAGPLFKMRSDPRVTRVGRWLRRLSIDELPQLINVIRSEMSFVGPRPPLRSEVATYTGDVHRRLLVKPGITGLWQVSGRSNLPWEESVRLDLYYVENWSLIQDLLIVGRTIGAVFKGTGAY
jgi:exopolysaccharide biosynthesis polyprenyl glycosylphosphotransferase